MLGLLCQSSPVLCSPTPPTPALSSLLSCTPKSLLPPSCLLYHSGVESPTHEIRADAAPSAHSAKSIIITLAKKHTFDRPVEILLHPSGMVSFMEFYCPCGKCLVSTRVGGMGEMGVRHQRLAPREIVSIWGGQIPSPQVPSTWEILNPLGCLRRSAVKLCNNSPSGTHL